MLPSQWSQLNLLLETWQDAMVGSKLCLYHAFSSISNVHWEDLAHCGWLQALFDQWKLSDVIGTGDVPPGRPLHPLSP